MRAELKRKKNQGMAVILAAAGMIIAAILGIYFLKSATNHMISSQTEIHSSHLRYTLEDALEQARFRLDERVKATPSAFSGTLYSTLRTQYTQPSQDQTTIDLARAYLNNIVLGADSTFAASWIAPDPARPEIEVVYEFSVNPPQLVQDPTTGWLFNYNYVIRARNTSDERGVIKQVTTSGTITSRLSQAPLTLWAQVRQSAQAGPNAALVFQGPNSNLPGDLGEIINGDVFVNTLATNASAGGSIIPLLFRGAVKVKGTFTLSESRPLGAGPYTAADLRDTADPNAFQGTEILGHFRNGALPIETPTSYTNVTRLAVGEGLSAVEDISEIPNLESYLNSQIDGVANGNGSINNGYHFLGSSDLIHPGFYIPIPGDMRPKGGIYIKGDLQKVELNADVPAPPNAPVAILGCQFQKISLRHDSPLSMPSQNMSIYITAAGCPEIRTLVYADEKNIPTVLKGRLGSQIYTDGKIDSLKGPLNGDALSQNFQLNIAAKNEIRISGNLTYADATFYCINHNGENTPCGGNTPPDETRPDVRADIPSNSNTLLGIVSTHGSVNLKWDPVDLTERIPVNANIHASIFAATNPCTDPDGCGLEFEGRTDTVNAPQGTLKIFGSLIEQKSRGLCTGSGGCLRKGFQYDERLKETLRLPGFPLSNFAEVKNATMRTDSSRTTSLGDQLESNGGNEYE